MEYLEYNVRNQTPFKFTIIYFEAPGYVLYQNIRYLTESGSGFKTTVVYNLRFIPYILV